MALLAREFPGGAATDVVASSSTITLGTTMSFYWRFKTTAEDATARRFLEIGDGAVTEMQVRLSTGDLNFRFQWTTIGSWDVVPTPSIGIEHDLLLVYDAGSTANDPLCWIDGSSVTVGRSIGPTGSWSPAARTFYIGNSQTANRCYYGWISTVAWWNNTLLGGDDATALHHGSAPCAVGVPANYWPMDQGDSPEAELMANNTGTVTGTTIVTGSYLLPNPRCQQIPRRLQRVLNPMVWRA